MVKPLSVTSMHCWMSLPHTLFCTTYRPPWMVVEPNFSQICCCAAASGAVAATMPVVANASATAVSTRAPRPARIVGPMDEQLLR
jgi:hypothetical protein